MNCHINDDSRDLFPYAFTCAKRHWSWLIGVVPQDARQTLSLACCLVAEKSVMLAREVDRQMYYLARNEWFVRDQKNLPRGHSGRWGARFSEDEPSIRPAPEGIETKGEFLEICLKTLWPRSPKAAAKLAAWIEKDGRGPIPCAALKILREELKR